MDNSNFPTKTESTWDRLRKVAVVEWVISLCQQIYSGIQFLGWDKVLGLFIMSVGTAVWAFIQDNLVGWPLLLIGGASVAVWMTAAYFRAKAKSLITPAFDVSDVKSFGKELRAFADDATADIRQFSSNFPRPQIDIDANPRVAFEANNRIATTVKAYGVTKHAGKASAYLLRLKSFGIEFNRDVTFHLSHDIYQFLVFLSLVGHALENGGLKEVKEFTGDDSWQLMTMTMGVR